MIRTSLASSSHMANNSGKSTIQMHPPHQVYSSSGKSYFYFYFKHRVFKTADVIKPVILWVRENHFIIDRVIWNHVPRWSQLKIPRSQCWAHKENFWKRKEPKGGWCLKGLFGNQFSREDTGRPRKPKRLKSSKGSVISGIFTGVGRAIQVLRILIFESL